MMRQPLLDLFPMMRTDMVAHEVNGTDPLVNLRIQRFQKSDEFPLPLPLITVPIDLARAGVKGRKEMERTRPLVLMLNAVGPVVGLGWQSRDQSGPRLQGGLLIEGEHQLISSEGTGIE